MYFANFNEKYDQRFGNWQGKRTRPALEKQIRTLKCIKVTKVLQTNYFVIKKLQSFNEINK